MTEFRMTVDNEQVNTGDITKGQSIDLHDRDPLNLNEHMKVTFQEIIGEPNSTVHSFDNVWIYSFKVFTNTKLWCYRITSLIFALPLSVCWGVYFACLSFCTIWVCVPAIKAYILEMYCLKRFYEIALDTYCRPCCTTLGYLFSEVRIRISKASD